MLAKLERGEKMSNEAKVGIFTTIGLALLIGIIVYLSGFSFGKEKDYTFDITFNQVTGLKIGAGVSYAGIDAGRVSAIEAYKDKARVNTKPCTPVWRPFRSWPHRSHRSLPTGSSPT